MCVYVQGTEEQSEPMILYVGSEDEANNNEVGGGQKLRGRNGRIKGKKNHKQTRRPSERTLTDSYGAGKLQSGI